MKALLVGEYKNGVLEPTTYELMTFAEKLGAEPVLFLVGSEGQLPEVDCKIYLADAQQHGEYNPGVHKQLLHEVAEKETPEIIALVHSSYGWDLAPRIALALDAAQASEVVDVQEGTFAVPVCNSKLRRDVKPSTAVSVVTLQSGAFTPEKEPSGTPVVEKISLEQTDDRMVFQGYEQADEKGVDLGKAEVIISAGRGVGKKDNIDVIAQLAKALGGELGASRPVVDSGWVSPDRQVGTTGQTVSPRLYVACGISGAIQHLAGMKKSDYVVAINKDKDAPIREVADVLVVADVLQFAPALVERLQ